MTNFEKQVNAIMRCLIASTEEEREDALTEIRGLLNGPVKPKPVADKEAIIRKILLDLGVPDHIKGHPYLIMAIGAVVEDETLINAITKELYPGVAKKYNTTASRVERAIRHAIECGWDRGDLDVMGAYFGNTVAIDKGKPTNSEFIARISNVVRARMKEAA